MPAKNNKKAVASVGSNWTAKKATKSAIEKFEETFARDMGVSPSAGIPGYEVTSTGSLALDLALTIGGYPSGRIVEMWGPEHAGKTTLAILYCAKMQREHPDQRVAWVDMEQTFDEQWAVKLGLDVTKMWFYTPKTAEETADAVRRFTESGLCSAVVIDSVGGMIARMEYEKEADEATVGLVAKIVTRMVKQCAPMAGANGTTVVVINQVRSKIGVSYGSDEDTSGGWALKHITTMKVRVARGTEIRMQVNGKEETIGHEINLLVQKNKCGPKGKRAVVTLFNQPTKKYGPVGIDTVAESVDFGILHGAIYKEKASSSWLFFPNGEKVNGRDKAVEYLREPAHKPVLEEVRAKVLASVAHQATDEEVGDQTELAEVDVIAALKFDEVVREPVNA